MRAQIVGAFHCIVSLRDCTDQILLWEANCLSDRQKIPARLQISATVVTLFLGWKLLFSYRNVCAGGKSLSLLLTQYIFSRPECTGCWCVFSTQFGVEVCEPWCWGFDLKWVIPTNQDETRWLTCRLPSFSYCADHSQLNQVLYLITWD